MGGHDGDQLWKTPIVWVAPDTATEFTVRALSAMELLLATTFA
jgi:hypothetical protein